MKFVGHVWTWLAGAVRLHRAPAEPRWIVPENAITRAIEAGEVGELPPLRPQYAHRPVTLDDYPALALALDELERRPSQPEPVAAPQPAAPASPARHERRTQPVSTRSARRRRHHHAA